MNTVEIENYKHTIYVPSDLSECDKVQYIELCGLIYQYQNQTIDIDTFKTHAVYKLMNMKHNKTTSEDDFLNITANIEQLKPLIDSFFESITVYDAENNPSEQFQIKQYYSHNPVPEIKPLLKTFYGPTDGFANIKFGEYLDALRTFQEFNVTGNKELLYSLAAILYRPKQNFHFIIKHFPSYDGDCRETYNSVHTNKIIKTLLYAPMGFIYGVYLYFASFQKFISTAEIQWGDRALNFSILYDQEEQSEFESEIQSLGMDSLIFSLAESGTFGDAEQVAKTSFWTIMLKMYDARKRELDEKKQQENAKSSTP